MDLGHWENERVGARLNSMWVTGQWCIDILIKGKLWSAPFGRCGFDERGLGWHPDGFIMEGHLGGERALGVSVRWRCMCSCRLGGLCSNQGRSRFGSRPSRKRPNQFFFPLLTSWGEIAFCSCDQNHWETKADLTAGSLLCRDRSALQYIKTKLIWFSKNARKVQSETWCRDTGIKPDLSQSRQVCGLLGGLCARIDTTSRPKITRYRQEIKCEHESLRRKLSHSQFFLRIWIPQKNPIVDLIWLAHRQDNVLKRASFYSPLASCIDFNVALTAVSLCLWNELSRICGRCFTRGVTKRRAPSLVCRDRAEHFTPQLSGGNICVLANGRRPLGRRGNRLPAAVRGDGPCCGRSKERDGDEGEGRGRGGNPCIKSSRGDTKEKSSSEGFIETPSACRSASGMLWITHSPSAVHGCHFLQLRRHENWILHF